MFSSTCLKMLKFKTEERSLGIKVISGKFSINRVAGAISVSKKFFNLSSAIFDRIKIKLNLIDESNRILLINTNKFETII